MNATLRILSETKLLANHPVFFLTAGRSDSAENFREPMPFIEEIHLRAETMTPLLKEILDFRPPPHWGINE